MCEDSSTDTKTDLNRQQIQKKKRKEKTSCVTCYVSHVTCHVSCVACHISPVTCHWRQQPQPQTLPLLTPPLRTVGWFAKTNKPKQISEQPKNQNWKKTKKNSRGMLILAIRSLTRSIILKPFGRWDRRTPRLLEWIGLGRIQWKSERLQKGHNQSEEKLHLQSSITGA